MLNTNSFFIEVVINPVYWKHTRIRFHRNDDAYCWRIMEMGSSV